MDTSVIPACATTSSSSSSGTGPIVIVPATPPHSGGQSSPPTAKAPRRGEEIGERDVLPSLPCHVMHGEQCSREVVQGRGRGEAEKTTQRSHTPVVCVVHPAQTRPRAAAAGVRDQRFLFCSGSPSRRGERESERERGREERGGAAESQVVVSAWRKKRVLFPGAAAASSLTEEEDAHRGKKAMMR